MAGANTGSAGTPQDPKPLQSNATGANTGSAGVPENPKPVQPIKEQ